MSGQVPDAGPPWPPPEDGDEAERDLAAHTSESQDTDADSDVDGDADSDLDGDSELERPSDLPGGRVFTLEGRRAPGLYLVAWLLSLGGFGLLFLGLFSTSATAGNALLIVGAVAAMVGLAAGAGSQVLDRADRHPDRYRGPSPPIAFGAYFFAMLLVGTALVGGLGLELDRPAGLFVQSIIQTAGYAGAVWLFAVRSNALRWRDMGWPTWTGGDPRSILGSAAYGAAVMVPVTLGVVVLGSIVALIVGVDAPRVLPLSETPMDALLVAASAALIIPLGEEVFFRGFALTAWLRDLGERPALIRSTVFFALIHIGNITTTDFGEGLGQAVLTIAAIVPVGWALGRLFLRGGLAASLAAHITYNGLLLTLALMASRIPEPA